MNFPSGATATGYLLARGRYPHRVLDLLASLDGTAGTPTVHDGWFTLTLRSTVPLAPTRNLSAEYTYTFLYRESGDRFLLLSTDRQLVHLLLERAYITPLVHRPLIRVSSLVNKLTQQPTVYCLGAVWARVNGYGTSFRTLVAYGEDLAESELFTRILERLEPYRASIRDVRARSDVMSIGSRGEIDFNFRNIHTLPEVDNCMRFLRLGGYLEWTADGNEGWEGE